jgi:hypothetical protein
MTDSTREARLVSDVCALLHDQTTATQDKIKRWLRQVLLRAQRGRNWWFLSRSRVSELPAGFDIFDMVGEIDRISSFMWGQYPIDLVSLSYLQTLRGRNGTLNAGDVRFYALESGHRVHLWPAPATTEDIRLVYRLKITIENVPEEWEPILMDGVLGLYGRHFDRDALTQDPEIFEHRFFSGLNECNRESTDLMIGRNHETRLSQWLNHSPSVMLAETVSMNYYAVPEIDFPGAET